MLKSLVSALVLLSATVGVFAAHANVVTADQMTCSELLREVKETGRYYKATKYDGAIPIYNFKQFDENGYAGKCGKQQNAFSAYERTKDTAMCVVGYRCE